MKPVLFSLFAATAASATITPKSDSTPIPTDVQIVNFTPYGGTGCPTKSVSSNISANFTTLIFGFDAYQVSIGPEKSISDRSKNCGLNVGMHYSAGYQYAIKSATWSGFAKLDEGANVTFSVVTAFSQCGGQGMSSKIIGGGDWADGMLYTKESKVPVSDFIFSPCTWGTSGGSVNIKTRVFMSENSTGAGTLNGTKLELNLYWRTCNK
jgi:hypothetical protein